jgi:hypothetical protein
VAATQGLFCRNDDVVNPESIPVESGGWRGCVPVGGGPVGGGEDGGKRGDFRVDRGDEQ